MTMKTKQDPLLKENTVPEDYSVKEHNCDKKFHIPVDVWIHIFEFLQNLEDFQSLYRLTKEIHSFTHWREKTLGFSFQLGKLCKNPEKCDFSHVANFGITESSILWSENASKWKFLDGIPIVVFDGQDVPLTDEHLQYLTKCADLDVRNCKRITGKAVSSLHSLQSLHIGSIKECEYIFETSTLIQKLDLHGITPRSRAFSDLKTLTDLTLNNAEEVPNSAFECLEQLKVLDLENCTISSFEFMGNLPNLKKLTIRSVIVLDNHEDVGISGFLYATQHLTSLSLYHDVTFCDSDCLGIPNLEEFVLDHSHEFFGHGLKFLPHLKRFHLIKPRRHFEEENFRYLNEEIELIHLDNCNLSDKGARHFQSLKKLKVMDLIWTEKYFREITQEGLRSLCHIPDLKIKGNLINMDSVL